MGELHFHPNGTLSPEPIIHTILDKKDRVKSIIAIVEYDDDQIEIIHSAMFKKDLCYYRDVFVKYVMSKIP